MRNNVVGKCRHCEGDLISVIDFGKMPIANAFLNIEEFQNELGLKNSPHTHLHICQTK